MGPFEVIVVFFNAWWIVFLPILGIGTQSQEETGTVTPGTERGAPVKIGMKRKVSGNAGVRPPSLNQLLPMTTASPAASMLIATPETTWLPR